MDPLKGFVAVGLLIGMTSCSAAPPPEKTAVEFRSETGITSKSWGKTSAGTRLEACPLYAGARELTIVLAVPTRFRLQEAEGSGCHFGTVNGFESLGVSGDAEPSLRDRMEKDLKPFEDIGGDDSVSAISYESDVPAFGGRRGEHLQFRCYCDGQDLQEESFRAGGVVVSASIPHEPMPKSALPIVRATVGVEAGRFGIVSVRDRAARYRVTDTISSIMSAENGVDLLFGGLNYHRIELRLGVGTLAEERSRLSRDPTVSGLTLTNARSAVAGSDGQRLDYDQKFMEYDTSIRVEHVKSFQAAGVRVSVINDGSTDQRKEFRDAVRSLG